MNAAADLVQTPPALAQPLTQPGQTGPLRITTEFLRRHPPAAAGTALLALFVVVAIFAPQVAPQDPFAQNVAQQFREPSALHWLGTDTFGRDVFSRIVYGSRISLFVGLVSVFAATLVGTLLGVTSAYARGWFDLLFQRIVDALLGFPSIVFLMVLVISLGASLVNVTLATAIIFTPLMIRVSRGAALSVTEEPYVLAARALGASQQRIALRHVLPNSLGPVVAIAANLMGAAVVAEAGLSFLGLGVPPPAPSWGSMLNEASRGGNFETASWLAIYPGIVLGALVFSFMFIGDGLRDALDPRLRK
jgi:peptide/nickel transport system permease protein